MATVTQILTAVELGRRTLARSPEEWTLLESPHEAASCLSHSHGFGLVEQFGVVMLDTKHGFIRTTVLSVRTLDASLVCPRELCCAAAECGAAAVALFHSHRSRDPAPSTDDVALTRRLVGTGVLMGIDVIDYLVLADSRCGSFKGARGI